MSGRPRTDKTSQRARKTFLEGLSRGLSATGSANLAAIGRDTAYRWRAAEPEFAQAWEDAVEAGTDILEDEARRRAFEGCEKPVIAMGRVARDDNGAMLLVREYSDALMTLLLKSRRPNKFRERIAQELSGDIAVRIGKEFDGV